MPRMESETLPRKGSERIAAYLKTETAKWGKLVREAGIRAN